MYTAMPSASASSRLVPPRRTSERTWNPMQASQWLATPSATAISSFVFSSSAPSRLAALPRSLKPFITSGSSERR